MTVLNALLLPAVTGVAIVGLAALDAWPILEGAPDVTSYCKRKLAAGAAGFLLLGVFGYWLAAATQYGLQLKAFNGVPPMWIPVVGGIVLVQALRLDYFRPTHMAGVQHAAGDRESVYRKLLRIWLNDVYRGLVTRLPDTEAPMLIRRGLSAAYTYNEMAAEFRTWSDGRANSVELVAWLDGVQRSKYPETGKAESLIRRLLLDDLPSARKLATRRAPAIVLLKAF